MTLIIDLLPEILIVFFAFLFRYFRELEDEIIKGNHNNYAFWPNSDKAWTAKWKYPIQPYKFRWYNLWTTPTYKERFPYSSTILVFLTDAEHLYQFIQTVVLLGIVATATFSNAWYYGLGAFISGVWIASILKESVRRIN